ncbi:TPA: hypothetical protein ACH3X3_007001 [Trebouxia sp. C0006]
MGKLCSAAIWLMCMTLPMSGIIFKGLIGTQDSNSLQHASAVCLLHSCDCQAVVLAVLQIATVNQASLVQHPKSDLFGQLVLPTDWQTQFVCTGRDLRAYFDSFSRAAPSKSTLA